MNHIIVLQSKCDYPFHRNEWQDEKKHLVIQLVKQSFQRQQHTESCLRLAKISAYGVLTLSMLVMLVVPGVLIQELLK